MTKKKVLVLGASGMLGNAMLRVLAASPGLDVAGSLRSNRAPRALPAALHDRLVFGVDVENHDALVRAFGAVRPDVVVNCIGLVKQLAEADDPLAALPINAMLPHRLARLCAVSGARLIHFSTDCVFSGSTGAYVESDFPDANDLYGRSKYLGEVDYPNALTLRTSIIGHELEGARSLVGWFLAQPGPVRGFSRAVFSGLPTVEIAEIVRDLVLPRPELTGLYHLSAQPVNKFDLLTLVARAYGREVEIQRDERLVIDRSLDSTRFRQATGYAPPDWPELIHKMHEFQ
jgi:dTDP-4-dehydrorhamnose reductase